MKIFTLLLAVAGTLGLNTSFAQTSPVSNSSPTPTHPNGIDASTVRSVQNGTAPMPGRRPMRDGTTNDGAAHGNRHMKAGKAKVKTADDGTMKSKM